MKTIFQILALIAAIAALVAAFVFFFTIIACFFGGIIALAFVSHLFGTPFHVTENGKIIRTYKFFKRVK